MLKESGEILRAKPSNKAFFGAPVSALPTRARQPHKPYPLLHLGQHFHVLPDQAHDLPPLLLRRRAGRPGRIARVCDRLADLADELLPDLFGMATTSAIAIPNVAGW